MRVVPCRSAVAVLVLLVVAGLSSPAGADTIDPPDGAVDATFHGCRGHVSGCGASVYLGPGPYAGVANQSRACGGPACRTARVVGSFRGEIYSDFVPVEGRVPRVVVAAADAASGSGEAGPTGGDPAAPAPAPPPPSTGEALATCPQPTRSEIGRNPRIKGLTGLETWLWASPVAPLWSQTSIRGYGVFCIASPYRWEWQTGDGGFYAAGVHGDPHPDNPVSHLYETKNPRYVLRLDVRWQLVTNFGSAHEVTSTMEPYQVIEVRSVLVDPHTVATQHDRPPPDRLRD